MYIDALSRQRSISTYRGGDGDGPPIFGPINYTCVYHAVKMSRAFRARRLSSETDRKKFTDASQRYKVCGYKVSRVCSRALSLSLYASLFDPRRGIIHARCSAMQPPRKGCTRSRRLGHEGARQWGKFGVDSGCRQQL